MSRPTGSLSADFPNILLFVAALTCAGIAQAAPSVEIRILVVPVDSSVADREFAADLTARIRAEIATTTGAIAFTPAMAAEGVSPQFREKISACVDEACAAQIAREFDARLIIFGRLARLGSHAMLAVWCLDPASGRRIDHVGIPLRSADDISARTRDTVARFAVQRLLDPVFAPAASPIAADFDGTHDTQHHPVRWFPATLAGIALAASAVGVYGIVRGAGHADQLAATAENDPRRPARQATVRRDRQPSAATTI